MSSAAWTLDPDAEREILLTWLEREPDPNVRDRVIRYIADLLLDPWRAALEDDDTGIYAVERVPGTNISVTWTLDVKARMVVLTIVS